MNSRHGNFLGPQPGICRATESIERGDENKKFSDVGSHFPTMARKFPDRFPVCGRRQAVGLRSGICRARDGSRGSRKKEKYSDVGSLSQLLPDGCPHPKGGSFGNLSGLNREFVGSKLMRQRNKCPKIVIYKIWRILLINKNQNLK